MSLLTAEPKQFQLKEDGQIYFQADATNPLSGVAVARLVKGDTPLGPRIEWLDDAPLEGLDLLAVTDKIVTWFSLYVTKVLEPLVTLPVGLETLPEPVQEICKAVYADLGIVPRQNLLDQIEKLDADMRKTLRTKHVRLGPVLVFVPDLNKPAAVRLRAILWSLYHDKPLPAPVPKDGAVSVVIDPSNADPVFYQAIGYPLYGNRIIRIDMLDRVMNAVYENVKENQFQAKHQMAEWLGCSIPDLYTVLEAMGHKKISDPAETKVEAVPAETSAAAAPEATEPVADTPAVQEPAVEGAPVTEATPEAAPEQKSVIVKPELATFRVWWPRKNNHRSNRPDHAPRRKEKEQGPKTPPPFEYLDPAELAAKQEQASDKGADKKDWRHKKDEGDGSGRGRSFNRSGGGRDTNKQYQGSRKPSKPSRLDKNLRLVSSAAAPAAKPEDSPFAILAGLKFKQD